MNIKRTVAPFILVILIFGCILCAGCTYTSIELQEKEYPILGGWQTQITTTDGAPSTAILTVNNNGLSYFMVLGKKPNLIYSKATELSWVKINDNTYEFTSQDGTKYTGKYNPNNDTLSGDYNFTRMDALVGIWTSVGTEPRSHYKSTDIIKPDGTGREIIANPDGSTTVYEIKWQKTGNNAYEIQYNDGNIIAFTLDNQKNTRISNQTVTKRKVFDDSTFYFAINGPWYNSDNQWTMILNGDGSGYIKSPTVTYELTWELDNSTTFKTKYLSGLDLYGHTLVGKTYTWSYDIKNNTITNSNGDVFIQPTEDVPDMIIFA